MIKNIKSEDIDTRYETCRIKNKQVEKELLDSVIENGILEPLEVINIVNKPILLNGFKRYRNAIKAGIESIPCISIGENEVIGILELLKISNKKTLNIIEQAQLIDKLHSTHKMNIVDISQNLDKSKSWVSMRLGLIKEMDNEIKNILFNGEFPVYAYMYTMRQFMRMNYAKKDEISEFIQLIAGKKLSTRSIENLAYGYFKGSSEFKEQIKNGDISWALKKMNNIQRETTNCNKTEQAIIRSLDAVNTYIQRILMGLKNPRLKSQSFFAQSNFLAGGILSKMKRFNKELEEFYDRSGKA